jgi:hypothetical protein|tara:strand:+ start:6288 stop:6446 length:159 start_codon:yes stop_codon:yes gene_type:complete
MSKQEVNPQTFISVLIEQRNEALNKLASSAAYVIELEQQLKELQNANENKDD